MGAFLKSSPYCFRDFKENSLKIYCDRVERVTSKLHYYKHTLSVNIIKCLKVIEKHGIIPTLSLKQG